MKETPEQFMEACRFAGQSIPLRHILERNGMKSSELIAGLQTAITRYGDLPVRVSLDLSTGDDATHGQRAFGDICDWTPGGGRPAPEIVILAESGVLNFKP